jgi:hypothetical protein
MEPLAEILRNFSSLESLRLSGCLKGQACFLTVCMCVCVCVCVCVFVCMCMCVCVCVYVYRWAQP